MPPAPVTVTLRPEHFTTREQRSQTMVSARDNNGAAWTLATTWTFALDATPPDRLEIVGERGGIDFETGAYLRQYGAKMREIDLHSEASDDPLVSEVAYFVDCISSARRPEAVTATDALSGLQIAEAALATPGWNCQIAGLAGLTGGVLTQFCHRDAAHFR